MAAVKPRVPTEDEEQITLFRWAELMAQTRWPELRLMYHVPNGGKRSKAEAGIFRAMGVKPGVPDVMLPVARQGYHGLYIEMKRTEGGRVSAEQRQWLDALAEQGYKTEVAYGWEQARKILEGYLDPDQQGSRG